MTHHKGTYSKVRDIVFAVLAIGLFFVMPRVVDAARLYMAPVTGSFSVGKTFTVKLYLDTEDQEINALNLSVKFPADKLQLVSPNTSVSLIDVWASQPKFNNRTGDISLRGGIPNGINTSGGLISELTFRVRSTGQAVLYFSSESQAYLNDGKATPAGLDFQNAIVQLELPPPDGPIVTSPTHDASTWTTSSDVALSWFGDDSQGYSFILDQSPVTEPDRTIDSRDTGTLYTDVPSGVSFFHIRSFRDGVWGGTTHYEVKIDTQPPADFVIDMFPSGRTSVRQPTMSFRTSDADSGISHYELNIVPLFAESGDTSQASFVEVTSPYITHELEPGAYDVLVRAHDKAGNYREVAKRLRIVSGALTLTPRDGLIIRDVITIPWYVLLLGVVVLAFLVGRELILVRKLKRVCQVSGTTAKKARSGKEIPKDVKKALKELQAYRKKYGHLAGILLVIVASLVAPAERLFAQESLQVDTPQVDSWSRYVTNNEIFYLRGTVDSRAQEVLVYVQDRLDGSLQSFLSIPDETGEWMYRHSTLLSPGSYALWVQGRAGEVTSPPSAQFNLIVEREAIRLGASTISLTTIYGTIIVLLALALVVGGLVLRHRRKRLQRRYQAYLLETKEAEIAIQRGFARLHKDLTTRLQELRVKSESGTLVAGDISQDEAELLADLEIVESRIQKEVADIEELLHHHDDELQHKDAA